MEHHRKTLEEFNEGVGNICNIDELINKIRSDEEFVNASHTISIIDTYERRILKKLEKENEEQKVLEHTVELELDQEIEAKIEEIENGKEEIKLKDQFFYSSKLTNFKS